MLELKPFGVKAYRFIMNPISKDARINILCGSVRSSKTFAMHPKLINLILHGPKGGIPLITGVSKETIWDNVLRDFADIVGPSNLQYNRMSGELTVFGRSIKVVGAKDEGSEKYILGKTVPWAYGDEIIQMPEGFFKQLLNRMSITGARFYGTTNPGPPTHYLYKEYITDKAKLESGMVRVYHFKLEDNPNIDDEYKTFIRSAYRGVYQLRYIEGKWVMAEGSIYKDCWDAEELVFDDETQPPQLLCERSVDRWIANDYGTDHPHIYLDVMDDGRDLWVVREYVWDSKEQYRQKTDKEYADDLVEFLNPEFGYPSAEACTIIIPPEAASFKAEVRTRGLSVLDADNEVLDGIRTTSSLMALRRIHIHKRCSKLIDNIPNYVWDEKASLRGVEQPLKKDDDPVDALRYAIKTKIKPWRLAA